MLNKLDEEIKNLFQSAKSIALISHIRPDGDAIGSLIGLGTGLLNNGKDVQMVLKDGLPEKYQHLPNSQLVNTGFEHDYDLLVVLDSSDLNRIGIKNDLSNIPDICIDHHKTNEHFAFLNLVDEKAVATASILAERMEYWGLTIDRCVASALLTGIIADTIGFRTSNMNAQTMRLSAELIEKGADLSMLYRQAITTRTFEEMHYWGIGLIKLDMDDAVLWTSLTLDDRIKSGYQENDDADLINILSSVAEILIALIFVEQEGGTVKVSWRSNGGIDVSGVAGFFGGGGHAAAAGADIKGDLSEVKTSVIRATKALIHGDFEKVKKQISNERGSRG